MKQKLLPSLLFGLTALFSLSSNAQVIVLDSTTTALPIQQDSVAGATQPVKDTLLTNTTPKRVHLYRENNLASGIFCAVATAADIYAIPNIIKGKKNLTPAELASLNPNIFNDLDRWALRQDPSQRQSYAEASDYMLPALVILPAMLAFDKNIKKDWFRILIMYYEMHSITFSIYNYSPFGPAFQNKYRPIVYYEQLPDNLRNGGNQRNSMYSGHTASAIASTFFMVKVYTDYHPEIGNKKYLLYAVAAIPPLIEGYLRVKALAHFPSDGLVGIAIGAACGILVPEIHRYKNKSVKLGITGTPVGPGIHLAWNID